MRCSKPTILALFLVSTAFLIKEVSSEEAAIEIEFSAIAVERSYPFPLYFEAPEGVFEEIDLNARRRSSKFTFAGSGPIFFYDELPRTNEETGLLELPDPIAEVPMDQLYNEPLFIFWHRPNRGKDSSSLQVLVMDDSERGFPFGHFVIVNACGANLVGRIGSTYQRIPSAITEPFSVREMINRNNRVELAFAVPIRDELELVYSNDLELGRDARTIIVLRPPRRPGSVRITAHSISEVSIEPDSET